jgi:two-component system, OmpR family, phosphate regulon response regulator PhoB
MEGNAVLLAEDDEMSRSATCQFLRRFGYKVGEATDGPSALREASMGHYDLVVLDLGLPGLAGEDVLAKLRRNGGMPVIVLTGRSEETERVRVLDLGADDYVVKPCSLHELEARIRAVLRRGQVTPVSGRTDLGRLVVDRTMHRVELDGQLLDLTPKEFDLLAFLADSPEQVYSREELLEHVWGSTQDWQDPATVTEHVRRLRLKLEADPASPRWLQTVRGVGYRLSRDDSVPQNGKSAADSRGDMSPADAGYAEVTPAFSSIRDPRGYGDSEIERQAMQPSVGAQSLRDTPQQNFG